MSLGSTIKDKRKMLKVSQEYVADQLGVSRQAVSKWETNQSEPSTDNLVKLADLFESDLKELVSPEEYIADLQDVEIEVESSQKDMKMQVAGASGRVLTLIGFLGYIGAYSEPASNGLPDWFQNSYWAVFFVSGLVLSFVASRDYFSRKSGPKTIIWFDFLLVFSFFFYDLLPFEKDINTLIILLYNIVILSIINVKFFIPVWRTPKLVNK